MYYILKLQEFEVVGTWASAGVVAPFWIFIHDTDKVEGGLMVLFFRCAPPPGNFSADALE